MAANKMDEILKHFPDLEEGWKEMKERFKKDPAEMEILSLKYQQMLEMERLRENLPEPEFTKAKKTEETSKVTSKVTYKVSDDLEQAIDTYLATYFGGEKEKQDWPFLKKMAIHFAEWQKQKDCIPVSEDLEQEMNKMFPILGHTASTKLGFYDIARHFANWQKQKDESYTKSMYKVGVNTGKELMKQQLMATAVDGTLLGGHLIRQEGITHPLHSGDKVKLIVIKEDKI